MRDIRVIERSQHFGLALEASHAARITSEGIGENLQRHVALQLGVAGAVDLAHTALSDKRENFVGPQMVSYGQRHKIGLILYRTPVRRSTSGRWSRWMIPKPG